MADPSTISPSAKALLLVKSGTELPFAREAAELLYGREAVEEAARKAEATPEALGRRRHFELRARSIDEALADAGATRVVELAAGLSFRGLGMALRRDVHYLDTDLPGIVATKAELVPRLHAGSLAGAYRIEALDALDAQAFDAAVASLPPGPLAVVHEGLLMYLDAAEKARLAANVRRALEGRGGAWITADVYVRSVVHLHREPSTQRFLDQHRVEEKKFAGWDAAQAFFSGAGFEVARRALAEGETWPVRQTWTMRLPPRR